MSKNYDLEVLKYEQSNSSKKGKNYDLEVLKYELLAATRLHRNCEVLPAEANACVNKNQSTPASRNRDLEVLKYELLASAISQSKRRPASRN
jgi:hypothetical protein